jgi:flagellar biosynthesis chaperone FliJ
MARDPLAVLARLRRLEVDQAKRQLAERLRAHALAEEGLEAAKQALVEEAEHDAAAYGAWLPRGLAERDRAEGHLRLADQATAAAREALTTARAAERAAEMLRERRAEEERREAERRAAASLDEIAAQRAARSA